jgi:hypothetical protein
MTVLQRTNSKQNTGDPFASGASIFLHRLGCEIPKCLGRDGCNFVLKEVYERKEGLQWAIGDICLYIDRKYGDVIKIAESLGIRAQNRSRLGLGRCSDQNTF